MCVCRHNINLICIPTLFIVKRYLCIQIVSHSVRLSTKVEDFIIDAVHTTVFKLYVRYYNL